MVMGFIFKIKINKMVIVEFICRKEMKELLKKEADKIQDNLFIELNKMREIVLKLQEENKSIRKLLR